MLITRASSLLLFRVCMTKDLMRDIYIGIHYSGFIEYGVIFEQPRQSASTNSQSYRLKIFFFLLA